MRLGAGAAEIGLHRSRREQTRNRIGSWIWSSQLASDSASLARSGPIRSRISGAWVNHVGFHQVLAAPRIASARALTAAAGSRGEASIGLEPDAPKLWSGKEQTSRAPPPAMRELR
jgi:hypothetical protein